MQAERADLLQSISATQTTAEHLQSAMGTPNAALSDTDFRLS